MTAPGSDCPQLTLVGRRALREVIHGFSEEARTRGFASLGFPKFAFVSAKVFGRRPSRVNSGMYLRMQPESGSMTRSLGVVKRTKVRDLLMSAFAKSGRSIGRLSMSLTGSYRPIAVVQIDRNRVKLRAAYGQAQLLAYSWIGASG